MTFLNKQERDALLNDIKEKNFNGIRGYVHGKDAKARLAYFRNAQGGKMLTRYVLEGLGTKVTVYEKINAEKKDGFSQRKYEIEQIVVEPTANNLL